jgi:hypothetical protein
MENPHNDFMLSQQDAYSTIRASHSFAGKVLFFFGLALLISAAGTFTGFQYIGALFVENPQLMWLFFAAELILVFTARIWSTRRPLNYFLFGLFAFVTGITIVPLLASIILEFGGPALIIKALGATTLTFSAVAVFGWTTNRDLSGLRGFLTASLIGIIIVSLIGIFLPWSNNFEMIFAGFGTILFSGYAMYDIQRLKTFPPDRYVDAALRLYLDIFNLFLFILRLIAGISRSR